MKHIAFIKPGRDILTIRTPSYAERADRLGETEAECLAQSIARLPKMPDGTVVPYNLVESDEFPSDRYFRNAWEWED